MFVFVWGEKWNILGEEDNMIEELILLKRKGFNQGFNKIVKVIFVKSWHHVIITYVIGFGIKQKEKVDSLVFLFGWLNNQIIIFLLEYIVLLVNIRL